MQAKVGDELTVMGRPGHRGRPLTPPASDVSWQDRAACAGTTMLLFFGPDEETRAAQEARETEAKAVCAACPVRAECLAYALRHSVRYGIWGGLNERERLLKRRRARRASAA